MFSFPLLVTGVLLLSSHSHQTSPFNCAFPHCLSQLSHTLLVQTSVPPPPREVTPKHAAFHLNGRKDRFGCTHSTTQPSILQSESLLFHYLVTSILRDAGSVPTYSARMKSKQPVSCILQPSCILYWAGEQRRGILAPLPRRKVCTIIFCNGVNGYHCKNDSTQCWCREATCFTVPARDIYRISVTTQHLIASDARWSQRAYATAW